jgi:TetR/AcrR family transcriptional regulator
MDDVHSPKAAGPKTGAIRLAATDRRRQVLEAALDAFSRKGFEGTTTKEIAAAAGVTEAIVFRHFPSKQALYAAVLEYGTESCDHQDWLERVKARMEQNDDAGVLEFLATAILEGYRADLRFQRVMLFAALEGHEQGLAHHRQLASPILQLLRDYFERRQREGALRSLGTGPIIVAIAGVAQYYSMLQHLFGYPSSITDEEAAAAFASIVLNGIRATGVPQLKGNS